ncbi:isoamyl acetate-hydrolyzing esterase 1 homolog isoform X2 [Glandiceps talaboti]
MWPQVVLFGDSHIWRSFGDGHWGASLANRLQRRCDVLCRGFGGYNSTWCNIMLPQLITKEITYSVAIVTIFLGTNDSVFEGYVQNVPLDKFKLNLKEMIQYLNSVGVGNKKIILISPPTVNEPAWNTECKKNLGHGKNKSNEITAKYAEVCCTLGKDLNVSVVDLFNIMSREQNWERFLLPDGIHLSVEGSKLLEKHLFEVIEDKIQHIKVKYPLWNEVSASNPESTMVE